MSHLYQFPHSPLRYPGGKTRAINLICVHIPKNEIKLCSPFLGGASVELACSVRMKVYGADLFEPLITFWRVLLASPELLVTRVKKYLPLLNTTFCNLQKQYKNLTNEIERAAVFFVLNRSSFSGATFSGGMSIGHPRFNEAAIERLRLFKAKNFHVECADYQDTITKHKDAFLYLDPPYANDQALYGVKGDKHKNFNHCTLAKLLNKRERWIMSYNGCYDIRELYKNNVILPLEWSYGMSKNKQSDEILILSRDLTTINEHN